MNSTRQIDCEQVKLATAGRWGFILRRLVPELVPALDAGPSRKVNCPLPHHDDSDPSFRIDKPDEGRAICSCGSYDGWHLLELIRRWDFPTCLAQVAGVLHLDGANGNGNGNGKPATIGTAAGQGGKPPVADPLARMAETKRCPVESLRAYGGTSFPERGVVSFPMFDGDGAKISQFNLWPDHHGELQRKGMNEKGKPAGVFLPVADRQARKPQAGETCLVLEGVKDTAAAHGMGLQAVGLPGKSIKAEWLKLFKGVHATVCLNNDGPGREAAPKVAKALQGVAASVRIVTLPHPGDLRDNLAADGGEQAVRDAIEQAGQEEESDEFDIVIRSSAELDEGDFVIRWFIENFFAIGQDGILAGGMKVLKTTFAVALGISIATGIPFLGVIPVTTIARVLVLSGESGLAVLQETARRICKALGIKLRDIDKLFWSDCLPRFDNPVHVAKLAQKLEVIRGGLLILDPAYLCLPGDDAGNVFAQGKMLREISFLCRKADVTLLLIHHFSKGRTSYEVPELQDLAWAGFGEFARQWILASRRDKYVPGTGEHRLWLSAGGSAGHNQTFAVDVAEGLRTDPDGRRWDVTVNSFDDVKQDAKRQRELRQAEKLATQEADDRRRVLDVLRNFPEGETKSAIKELVGIESKRAGRAIATLIGELRVEKCEVLKNGRKEDAYKVTGK